ncbi:MAG: acyltransferase, partial [Clostridia bacterium]
MNSFYSQEELESIGFKSFGKNVLISRKVSIYGAKNISIGNNVRIDDFCILSGKITLGNYIHVSAYSSIFAGEAEVVFKDFVTFSSRSIVYAVSDDYSGEHMTNPMVPEKYINV